MQLSKALLSTLDPQRIGLPDTSCFTLPEKVLQFGTGVLLRGLPDYFIDKANKQGIFQGRIVLVKSTTQGDAGIFSRQDYLYSTCIRGIEEGKSVSENIVNASVSRLLEASNDWPEILACMQNPELSVIISNTTETGIRLLEESVKGVVPESYPGKLLALLLARFQYFKGNKNAGLIVIPTELLPDNGPLLLDIIEKLARYNALGDEFIGWLHNANHFCSSLVDRIVPGKLAPAALLTFEQELGYEDQAMLMCEPYRLWAIETSDESVKEKLSFYKSDAGVVITADIQRYRELKLRLLNGTHTLSCGLAFLAGYGTVANAMQQPPFREFVRKLMFDAIIPAITGKNISGADAADFARTVTDRFSNPQIEHAWIQITLQYSSKMRLRNMPILQYYLEKNLDVPDAVVLGFAAFLLFMKCRADADGKFYGQTGDLRYPVQDDQAAIFASAWSQHKDTDAVVIAILSNRTLWGMDLSVSENFCSRVATRLRLLADAPAGQFAKTAFPSQQTSIH